MKLLITRCLPDATVEAARALFNVTYRNETTPLGPADLRAALQEHDAILPTLGDLFKADVFADVPRPRARILANFGVGTNHIDVAAARAAGLQVTNTPGAVTDATADIALTLILMTARRASEGERLLRAGNWTGWHPTQLLGTHVTGKTVGIIGMGRIGQAIARRCHHGFGMHITYHTRSPLTLDFPATQTSLSQTLKADFVVLAVPATPATHHLINAETLSQMRPTSYLINIARGDVIDESALIHALQTHQIAGAGLDVYEFEPRIPQALIDLPNTTLLPHLGTAALQVRQAMGQMAIDNLKAHLHNSPLPNPV